MDNKVSFLRDNGVEVDTAIENMIDVETYNEMLDDYYNAIRDDFEKLVSYKNNNDLENYAIQVHAMKSNARSFGFMKLGDIAYSHEMASKEGNMDFVNQNFEQLKACVVEVYNLITKYKSM